MDTSDDPATMTFLVKAALIGGTAVAGVQAQQAAKSGKKARSKQRKLSAISAAEAEAAANKQTAVSLKQDTEAARRNKRLRASLMVQGFDPPTLGTAGLLGVRKGAA